MCYQIVIIRGPLSAAAAAIDRNRRRDQPRRNFRTTVYVVIHTPDRFRFRRVIRGDDCRRETRTFRLPQPQRQRHSVLDVSCYLLIIIIIFFGDTEKR